MCYKLALAVLVAFLLLFVRGQDDISPPDILILKFELNHTRLPELMTDLLISGDYKHFTNETLYLKDALNFAAFSDANYSVLDLTFAALKVNLSTPFADRKIEAAFKALNLSIIDIYQTFVRNYNGTKSNILNALSALGLNLGNINTIILYHGDKAEDEINFFNELNKGNYSEANVINITNILNLTSDQLIDTIINLVGNKSMDEVLKLGPSIANILPLVFQNLSINSEQYEIYKPFETILTNYTDEANAQGILATAYNESSFITLDGPWRQNRNLRIVGEVYKDNSTLPLSNLTAALHQNHFVSLSSPNINNSYANISKNYTSPLNNCSVIIYRHYQSIITKPLNITMDVDYLYIQLENDIYPNISSPLICNNALYGLATSKDVDGLWQFQSFNNLSLTESSTQIIATNTSVHDSESTSTDSTSTESTSTESNTTSNGRVLINTALNIVILCLLLSLL